MLGKILAALLLLASSVFAAQPIGLVVDATDAPRNILHAALRIPVSPGPLTLAYPKWLPGNHRPSGPIENLTGLIITANGRRLAWQRDPVDMYAIHLQVPPGSTELVVLLDAITDNGVAGSTGPAASSQVLDINWNMVLLYPADVSTDAIEVDPSLRLPAGWKFASALDVASQSGDEITFRPVSLTMLVDSPLIAARHFRRVALDRPGDTIPHFLDIAAESDSAMAFTPQQLEDVKNLVTQTGRVFRARHYLHYDLLLTLSDEVGGRGLEHHQSSDNAPGEEFFTDSDHFLLEGSLLPHEFTHSWNGKYRRPAGLATRNYQQPMIGDLLWVYEGLTDYLGGVLAARSGFWTPEQYRDDLAVTAAQLDFTPGRTWRPLEDTAVSVQSLRLGGRQWSNWRRGLDYYPEGDLIWLEVDARIRQLTNSRRSLDDFLRLFHGGQSGPPNVVPYRFDDIVAALNQVAPYQWATLLRERVNAFTQSAPKQGIELSGWKLVYTAQPNLVLKAAQNIGAGLDLAFSLGVRFDKKGNFVDVIVGSPAYRAGLAPHMKLVAVNSHEWSPEVLEAAIVTAQKDQRPIVLLVENAGYIQPYSVDYFDGPKYPHLERVSGQPDRLAEILKPLPR